MKGDRLRVPIDATYLSALGMAVICFARLEWNAVWCCEKLQLNYLRTVGHKTAGQIAQDLERLAATYPETGIAFSLGDAAVEFTRLTQRRNDLLHANPATAPNGDQRLFRNGGEWTVVALDDVADEFSAASMRLNNHFHNLL